MSSDDLPTDGTLTVPGLAKPERAERARAVAYSAAAAGLALFVALIAYNGVSDVIGAFAVGGPWLPAVALFHLAPLVANAAAWCYLLPEPPHVGFGSLVRARWISESVNGLLPVMQIGGNVVRARLLIRRGLKSATAGPSSARNSAPCSACLPTRNGSGSMTPRSASGTTAIASASHLEPGLRPAPAIAGAMRRVESCIREPSLENERVASSWRGAFRCSSSSPPWRTVEPAGLR
jgi:hypothetical protein